MSEAVTFKDMLDELRRLEDCVTYFENAVLKQQIAVEEYARVAISKNNEASSNEEFVSLPDMEQPTSWRGMMIRAKRYTDAELYEAIKRCRGSYADAAKMIGVSTVTLYKRCPVNKALTE